MKPFTPYDEPTFDSSNSEKKNRVKMSLGLNLFSNCDMLSCMC